MLDSNGHWRHRSYQNQNEVWRLKSFTSFDLTSLGFTFLPFTSLGVSFVTCECVRLRSAEDGTLDDADLSLLGFSPSTMTMAAVDATVEDEDEGVSAGAGLLVTCFSSSLGRKMENHNFDFPCQQNRRRQIGRYEIIPVHLLEMFYNWWRAHRNPDL